MSPPVSTTAPTEAPPTDAQLRASYEACRRAHRRHDPTYYFATRRLPAEVRPAIHALYGYVRAADELVDGPRRPVEPADRLAALDALEGALEAGIASGGSRHPAVCALVDAGRRHDLPLDELRPYMASMRIDCEPVRIESWCELERYMQGSAGSVGRIVAPLLGAPERREDFARLGLAFQLTNFIRDVRVDWDLGRVYLPREDLERFGASEDDIARREPTDGFRALVAFEVARARELFAAAGPAIGSVPARVRPGMRLACAIYGAVLDRVEANGFDVLRRGTRPRPWSVGRVAVGALRSAA
jgi:15-cis-phytoene synthase